MLPRSWNTNDSLGRKRVTVGEVKSMLNRSGLSGHTGIEKEGGLWLVIKKLGEKITGRGV